MSGIVSIDSGSTWLPRDPQGMSSPRDFADELAKDSPPTAAHAQPATGQQRDAKAAAEAEKQVVPGGVDGRLDDVVQAVSSEETASGLPMAQQQALQPVAPVGVTEAFIGARVFGLHLSAQGYLSVLSAAQLSEDGHMPGISQADVAAAMAQEQDGATNVATREAAIELPTSESTAALTGVQIESLAGSELDYAHMASNVEAAAGASASAMTWPERVIRSVRDSNQGLSIWLRDYRVTADDTSKLVGELIEHARMQGEHLNRIILNGREVWASRNSTNQGDSYVG
jgi:hypothetical protein